MSDFSSLPLEVQLDVVDLLPPADLRSSTDLRIISNESLWRIKTRQEFGQVELIDSWWRTYTLLTTPLYVVRNYLGLYYYQRWSTPQLQELGPYTSKERAVLMAIYLYVKTIRDYSQLHLIGFELKDGEIYQLEKHLLRWSIDWYKNPAGMRAEFYSSGVGRRFFDDRYRLFENGISSGSGDDPNGKVDLKIGYQYKISSDSYAYLSITNRPIRP